MANIKPCGMAMLTANAQIWKFLQSCLWIAFDLYWLCYIKVIGTIGWVIFNIVHSSFLNFTVLIFIYHVNLQPKGADRKQKTDREKMEKRTPQEKEKYQPSYETTILTEVMIIFQSGVCNRGFCMVSTHSIHIFTSALQPIQMLKNKWKNIAQMYADVNFDMTFVPKLWPNSLVLLFLGTMEPVSNLFYFFLFFFVAMGSKPLVSAKHKQKCIDFPSIFSDTLLGHANHHSTLHLCPSAQMCTMVI